MIILILMAMGFISCPGQFNDEFRKVHSDQVEKANLINSSHQYTELDGGVVLEEDVNPHH